MCVLFIFICVVCFVLCVAMNVLCKQTIVMARSSSSFLNLSNTCSSVPSIAKLGTFIIWQVLSSEINLVPRPDGSEEHT